jgi:ankyrin repeat protein
MELKNGKKRQLFNFKKHFFFFIVAVSVLIPNSLNAEIMKTEAAFEKEKSICDRLFVALESQDLNQLTILADQVCINKCIKPRPKYFWPDELSTSLLHEACKRRNSPAIELLLKKGMRVNIRDHYGYTPLHFAHEKSVVKLLISYGADVNAHSTDEGNTPLHRYGGFHEKKRLKNLLKLGAHVDARNFKDETPLHTHIRWGEVDEIKVLIRYGADVNARKKEGITPLHLIKKREKDNDIRLAELLISHGADINAQTNNGNTPLHEASHGIGMVIGEEDNLKLIETLLKHNAHVNARNLKGETPLHTFAPSSSNFFTTA